jgi:hypothetical protein
MGSDWTWCVDDALKEFQEKALMINCVISPKDLKEHVRPAFDKRKYRSNHWFVPQQSQSIFLE